MPRSDLRAAASIADWGESATNARPLGWVNGEVGERPEGQGRDLHARRPVGECRERLPAAAAGDHAAAASRDELVLG